MINSTQIKPNIYPQYQNIPEELKLYPNFAPWLLENNETGGKHRKLAKRVGNTLVNASSTDLGHWGSYNLACQCISSNPEYNWAGIGFLLTQTPFVMVDLDNCRCPYSGKVDEWASMIVLQLKSYTEISPSGKGLKIIIVAEKINKGCRKKLNTEVGLREVETYSENRWTTLTGVFAYLDSNYVSIQNRQKEYDQFISEYFDKESKQCNIDELEKSKAGRKSAKEMADQFISLHSMDYLPEEHSNETVIEKCLNDPSALRFKKLFYDGDTQGYASYSEADLALCGLLARHTSSQDQIDELFRLSKICREKWEQRQDYRESTITKALYKSRNNKTGALLLRFHKGLAYRYSCDRWEVIPDVDLNGIVMAFLRSEYPGSASNNTLRNVIANLRSSDTGLIPSSSNPPIWLGDRILDAKGWLTADNCLVNVIGLAKNEKPFTKELTPDLFTTFSLGYSYDLSATCVRWLQFLEEVQPNAQGRAILQMVFGLCLIPETKYNCFFILYGDGGTGKTTVLKVLEELVGKVNVCCHPLHKFADKFSTHLLAENLLNICGELPTADDRSNMRNIEGILKQVTSGDMIPIERKGKDPSQAPAIARCIFATNTLPFFYDKSDGLWDRLRIVPFTERFRGTDKQDSNLTGKLITELPGIFNWAIDGLRLLLDLDVFPQHPFGKELMERHRLECDKERMYLEENVFVDPQGYAVKDQLYRSYKEWAISNGYRSLSVGNFFKAVAKIYPFANEARKSIGGESKRCLRGIRLNVFDPLN